MDRDYLAEVRRHERERTEAAIADYLDRYAARLRAGPPARASWQTPVNTIQHAPEEAAGIARVIACLSATIREGLAEPEAGWPKSEGQG